MSVSRNPSGTGGENLSSWPAASHTNLPAKISRLNYAPPQELAVLCESAAIAAVRFEAEMVADISPLAAVLLRSEAASSSQIENLSASARSILMAEIGDTTRQNATLIAANTKAMMNAIVGTEAVTRTTILDAHKTLMASEEHQNPGRFRTEPVWIGGQSPVNAAFVGVDAEAIPEFVQDLVDYCARTDIPVLVQAAIAHAQFETIHPFTDGNGRTGRVLVHQILRATGTLQRVALPLSGALLGNVRNYYLALDEYRAGNPAPIISLFANSIFNAIENGQELAKDIAAVEQTWLSQIRLRSDSGARRLLEYALRQPVFSAAIAIKDLQLTSLNFYRYAQTLTDSGILIRSKFHRDSDVWRAPLVIDAMDAFAARCGFRKPGY